MGESCLGRRGAQNPADAIHFEAQEPAQQTLLAGIGLCGPWVPVLACYLWLVLFLHVVPGHEAGGTRALQSSMFEHGALLVEWHWEDFND